MRAQLILLIGSIGLVAAGLDELLSAFTQRIVPKAVFQGDCADDPQWISPDGHGYTCSDWADEAYGPDPCRTHGSGQAYLAELFKACPLTCKMCNHEAPPVPRKLVRDFPLSSCQHSPSTDTDLNHPLVFR